MIRIRNIISQLLFLTIAVFTPSAFAENSITIGDFVVHYNAFRSDTLTPEIAQAYQLTRRNNRIVVNIAVQKKLPNGKTQAVKADVSGFASNLTGQVKNMDFREILDGDAIYYIAESQVSNREVLNFQLKVKPNDSNRTANVKFQQEFYTD